MSTLSGMDGVAQLIERLAHPDRLERVHAAVDLVRLGRRGCRPEEALAAALKDERPVVRKMAALVLGDLAPDSRAAIPALIETLGDAEEGVRRRAAVALGQFGPEATAAIPALRAALDDSDEGVRSFANASLLLIEPPAARAA